MKMPKFVASLCWLVMLSFDAAGLLLVHWLSWHCPQWLMCDPSSWNSQTSADTLIMSPLVWLIAIVLLIAADAVFVTFMDSWYEGKNESDQTA